MANRAPAGRRPRKAKPHTKGLDPAQCRLEQSEGSAAEATRAVEKAGGCVVGLYKDPLGGHQTLLSILPIDKVEPTPFQRDLSDAHHKRLADVISKTGRFLDPVIAVVAPDGKIYFNLLPGIDVWGKTLGQAKAALEQEMAKYVRQQPQVSLVLRGVESKHIWVMGRVQVPGIYPMAAPMTLLEAISLAGGTMSLSTFQQSQAAVGIGDELADLSHSFVVR